MKRRALLSSVVGVGFAAGCLGRKGSSSEASGGGVLEIEPSGSCGIATEPLSSRLVPEGGTEACFDGAEPSLAVENEREEPIEAAVEIVSGGSTSPDVTFAETYGLEPGERAVEHAAFVVGDETVATVTLGEETVTGSWEGASCYRHGIAIVPGGIEFGLVPPMSGPGDTQHDCYAGDDASIRIDNGDEAWTVTLQVVDHCAGSTVEETFEMEPGGVESVRNVIVNGGMYDVTVSVEDGGSETYVFEEECWGLSTNIDADGEVTVRRMAID